MSEARQQSQADVALICILSAVFLLRVPSECLGLQFDCVAEHSSLQIRQVGDRQGLVLSLRRRKNLPQGSVLQRACTCPQDQTMCAMHALLAWNRSRGRAWTGPLFSYPASSFSRDLRKALVDLGIEDAHAYSSQSFRRGTAQELASSGGSLACILEAGQWHSRAFMAYLAKADIEEAAVLDLIMAGSESEGEKDAPATRCAVKRPRTK